MTGPIHPAFVTLSRHRHLKNQLGGSHNQEHEVTKTTKDSRSKDLKNRISSCVFVLFVPFVFLVVKSGTDEEETMPDDKKTKHIACGDVVAGCGFTASAATEDELIKQVVAHAAHDHGVTEVTPELAAKVQAAIKTR